nr:hypothetical protein GCM10020063_030830 [Dactylosporangium thailandense]
MLIDEKARALPPARLLVGDEREHDVAGRYHIVTLELPRDRQRHGHHVLHVDRAASPQVAVADLAGEGRHGPLGRVGRHHIEVTVHEERATLRVGAGQAHDDVAALGRRLQVHRLETGVGEALGHELRRGALVPAGAVVAGVRGVVPHQCPRQLHDLTHDHHGSGEI